MNITDFNIRTLATVAIDKHEDFLQKMLKETAEAANLGSFSTISSGTQDEYEALRFALAVDKCKICKLASSTDGKVTFKIYWGVGEAAE